MIRDNFDSEGILFEFFEGLAKMNAWLISQNLTGENTTTSSDVVKTPRYVRENAKKEDTINSSGTISKHWLQKVCRLHQEA